MTFALVLFGILSFSRLPVRDYPDIETPVISLQTVYPGASSQVVETNVTSLIEESLSGIQNLSSMYSSSRAEVAWITLEFQNRDLDAASNDVRDRLAAIRRRLPTGVLEPIIFKARADEQPIIFLSLHSDRHTDPEITDYAERYLKDRFNTVPGVSQVSISGARRYAMRVWLDAERLASRELTVQDVEQALLRDNVSIPSGRIESDRKQFIVHTGGEFQTPEQFKRLIVAYRKGYPTRLDDVANVELGTEQDRQIVRENGKPTLGLSIVKQSKGNTLAVARAVKQKVPELEASLPEGMRLGISGDGSRYIEESIREVYIAMGMSLLLVAIVTFLFLGSIRATMIPVVAIPASIISTLTVLYVLGYSINILTLLGFVLAVGLVVDDAIVMLENIQRQIENGHEAKRAAMQGSREVRFAVVATTISLVAVFVPMAFLTGPVGRLFAELAVTVGASVLISGFIALTLTPMMCAKILRPASKSATTLSVSPAFFIQRCFTRLRKLYETVLSAALGFRIMVLSLGLLSFMVSAALFSSMRAELAPAEDTGGFMVTVTAPEGSTIRYTDHYVRQTEHVIEQIPEMRSYWAWVGTGLSSSNVSLGGSWISLRDWTERNRSQQQIIVELNEKLSQITGVLSTAFTPPALNQPGGTMPVQFVIGGPSFEEIERSVTLMLQEARAYPGIVNPKADLDEKRTPELDIYVERDKAADLGVSITDVGGTLQSLLGGRSLTTFLRNGKEYQVIVKVRDIDRVKPDDIQRLYVRGLSGAMVPLSNLVSIHETDSATQHNHFDKMRAATVTGGIAPGYTLGDALDYLEKQGRRVLPAGTPFCFAGESKAFKETSVSLHATFVVALLVIYLVLAVQFESFIHPITILLTVPPAIMGGLLALAMISGTINIYSQIGIIMLIGLVTKNAILIVDFANQLRSKGHDAVSAVIQGAALRLRPILMTTMAMILGAVPLALSTSAGAVGRQQIGWVIIGGMLLSTLLTLFLTPCVFVVLSRTKAANQTNLVNGRRWIPDFMWRQSLKLLK
jgi:multidrug efflux pump